MPTSEGQLTAIVRVDIGGGNVITSSITMAALKDLKLKKGSEVHAIIKASEVLLGTDEFRALSRVARRSRAWPEWPDRGRPE